MKLLNIGYNNFVSCERIVAVISPDAAPVKRMVQEARDSGLAIDASRGRRMRAVLVMDSGHVVLSSLQPETLSARIGTTEASEEVGGA